MTLETTDNINERMNWATPNLYVLNFKETKGGDAYDPVEDDWADPPVSPS